MLRQKKDPRRRNYFIDRKFQSEFIIKFCLVIIATTALAGVLTYFFTRQSTTVVFDNLRLEVKTTADFILPTISYIFVIVTFLAALMTIAVTVFTSHRIAGPLYRIGQEMERLVDGDLTNPVRVRARDQLQNIAGECEKLRLKLSGSVGALKRDVEEIRDLLEKGSSQEGSDMREILKNKIGLIETELERFRV